MIKPSRIPTTGTVLNYQLTLKYEASERKNDREFSDIAYLYDVDAEHALCDQLQR